MIFFLFDWFRFEVTLIHLRAHTLAVCVLIHWIHQDCLRYTRKKYTLFLIFWFEGFSRHLNAEVIFQLYYIYQSSLLINWLYSINSLDSLNFICAIIYFSLFSKHWIAIIDGGAACWKVINTNKHNDYVHLSTIEQAFIWPTSRISHVLRMKMVWLEFSKDLSTFKHSHLKFYTHTWAHH